MILVGVTQEFQQIRNLIIPRGRYFDDGDFATRKQGVRGVRASRADRLARARIRSARRIQVGELTFTVIGVFRERIETFGQSEIRTDSLLVPFPLVRYYTGDAFIVTLYAQADNAGGRAAASPTESRKF